MKKKRKTTAKSGQAATKSKAGRRPKASKTKVKSARKIKKAPISKSKTRKPVRAKAKPKKAVRKKRAPKKSATKKVIPQPLSVQAQSFFQDLPFSYNQTELVFMVRDPQWAFLYWDFSGETWQQIQEFFRAEPGLRAKLRIRNLDADSYSDLDVYIEAKRWYVYLGSPNTSFQAELGLLAPSGEFYVIARSNVVRTPRNAPSENIDAKWDPKNFEMMYQLSGGHLQGSQAGSFQHSSDLFSQFLKK